MRSRIAHRVLISAFSLELTRAENIRRTVALQKTITDKGFNFHKVLGTYKGVTEISLMVYTEEREFINELGRFFEQESVLHINSEGTGFLNMLQDETEIYLGDMVVLTEEPEGDNSYIFDLGVWFNFSNRFTTAEIEASNEIREQDTEKVS